MTTATASPTQLDLGLRLVHADTTFDFAGAVVLFEDVRAAFSQVDWLFRCAWACHDLHALRGEADRLGGVTASVLRRSDWRSGRSPGEPSLFVVPRFEAMLREAPRPAVKKLSLESPLESMIVIPGEMAATVSALAALMYLIERAWTLRLRIEARESQLEAQKAEFIARRTQAELKALDHYAEMVQRGARDEFKPMEAEIFDIEADAFE